MKTTIKFRRKREGRTNYKKRLTLLKSRRPRLVVRKTNRHIIAQIIDYSPKGDKVVCSVNSKTLEKNGWQYSTKSIPAAYLTGKLLGQKTKEQGIKLSEAILDLGLHTPVKGARMYAVAKGAIDSGLKICVSEEIFPTKERVSGEHITKYAESCKNKQMFSKYNNIGEYKKIFDQISKNLD